MAIPIVIEAIRKAAVLGSANIIPRHTGTHKPHIPAAGTIIIYSDIDKMKIADGVLTVPKLPWWEEEYTNSEIENLWKNT